MDFNLHPAIVVPKTGNHLINPFLNHPREAEDAIKTPQSHLDCTRQLLPFVRVTRKIFMRVFPAPPNSLPQRIED